MNIIVVFFDLQRLPVPLLMEKICINKGSHMSGHFIMKFIKRVGWLVGCFGLNGPLRQYFSLYRAVRQRREKDR